MTIHARIVWCPSCDPPQRLVRKDISPTHSIKGCMSCRRKFQFIRTDTPEGRRLRAKKWRENHETSDATGEVIA